MIKKYSDFHSIKESVEFNENEWIAKIDKIITQFQKLEKQYNDLEFSDMFNSYDVNTIFKDAKKIRAELEKLDDSYTDIENEMTEEEYDKISSEVYNKINETVKLSDELLDELEEIDKAVKTIKDNLRLRYFN